MSQATPYVLSSGYANWPASKAGREKSQGQSGRSRCSTATRSSTSSTSAATTSFPKPEWVPYVANGDLGVVVGEYKTKSMRGMPKKLEVEFAGQLGFKYRLLAERVRRRWEQPARAGLCADCPQDPGQPVQDQLRRAAQPLPAPVTRALVHRAHEAHRQARGPPPGTAHGFSALRGEEYSEIARRMTNLFSTPAPREVVGRAEEAVSRGGTHPPHRERSPRAVQV